MCPSVNLRSMPRPPSFFSLPRPGQTKKPAREEPAVASTGCKLRRQLRYVVYTTKGFKVAKTREELVRFVLPIDRPEKAASLVMALNPDVLYVVLDPRVQRT